MLNMSFFVGLAVGIALMWLRGQRTTQAGY